jgi:hypothetical protein
MIEQHATEMLERLCQSERSGDDPHTAIAEYLDEQAQRHGRRCARQPRGARRAPVELGRLRLHRRSQLSKKRPLRLRTLLWPVSYTVWPTLVGGDGRKHRVRFLVCYSATARRGLVISGTSARGATPPTVGGYYYNRQYGID